MKTYPRCVYHKDFDPEADEKIRNAHTKIVKSEEDHKSLGKDWGDHPSLRSAERSEEMATTEESPATESAEEAQLSEGSSVEEETRSSRRGRRR